MAPPPQGEYVQVFKQEQDVSGNLVASERIADAQTDNGGLVQFPLTAGTYVIRIGEHELFDVPFESGRLTVRDGQSIVTP